YLLRIGHNHTLLLTNVALQRKTAAAPCRHSRCSVLLASEPGTLLSFSACTGTTTHDFIIEKADGFCNTFPGKTSKLFAVVCC
uniref:hypothetical protein n=1 Tax=Faecalibacterium sp. TaxID=1971605 RepID=UPI0040293585